MSLIIKKAYLFKHPLVWLLPIAVFFCFFLNGCISRVEGCLDVAASNFDFNADRSCDDCCTYPLLSLLLSQKWDTLNFSNADTLHDQNGLPFKIIDLKYFLSSWVWQDHDDHSFTVDSAEISCPPDILTYTPDIIIVDSRLFQYSLGTIRQSPDIDSLFFRVGLVPDLDCVTSTRDDIPMVLSDQSALWDEAASSRATMRLVLQRDLTLETFDTIFIHTTKDVRLPFDFDIQAGRPTTFEVTVNYARWFKDVNVMDLNSFQASIEAGIEESFFQTPE